MDCWMVMVFFRKCSEMMMLLCPSIRLEHMIVGYVGMPTYDSVLHHAKSIFYPTPFLFSFWCRWWYLMWSSKSPPLLFYLTWAVPPSFVKCCSHISPLKRITWWTPLFSHPSPFNGEGTFNQTGCQTNQNAKLSGAWNLQLYSIAWTFAQWTVANVWRR